MNVQDFERVTEAFAAFHACFAPAFGRTECRENSQHYLHALLVQAQERKNAENLAETVPASPRALQRFLTESGWDDQAITEQLQQYLAARLNAPEGILVADESGFPKQGQKSVGVARQYCGTLGKVANCQMGVFLAYVSEQGRALVDKALYLPQAWIEDPARCEAAGVPEVARIYQTKPELAWQLIERAQAWGHIKSNGVASDDAYGQSPVFGDRLRAAGLWYVLDVPSNTLTWTHTPLLGWQRLEFEARAAALSASDWQAITVGEGAQGERTYLFACEPVYDNRDHKPVVAEVALYRKNLDGSEPRYYFAHAPQDTPLDKLARVAAARWSIETEFETDKDDVGLDEYEVRGWVGWHHHITLCLLASAFLLSLQQEWGEKDALPNPSPSMPGGAGTAAQANLDACGFTALARRNPTPQRTRTLFTPKAKTSPLATKDQR